MKLETSSMEGVENHAYAKTDRQTDGRKSNLSASQSVGRNAR